MKQFAPRHAAMLIVMAGLLVAANFAIAPRRRAQQTRSCQTNLKIIGLAMLQYVRDYDEKFPVAARWADDLRPWAIGSRHPDPQAAFDTMFHCPTTRSFYAFNSFYAQLSIAMDDNPRVSPLVFDVKSGARNFSDDGSLWPPSPIHETAGTRGNNVLFADGHVALRGNKPTFRKFATPTPKPPKSKPAKTVKP